MTLATTNTSQIDIRKVNGTRLLCQSINLKDNVQKTNAETISTKSKVPESKGFRLFLIS